MNATFCLEIVVHSPPPLPAANGANRAASRRGASAAPAPTAPPSNWAALPFELLLTIVSRIEDPVERKGAHLTCRALRGAVCHSLQSLAPRTPNAAALRASFPNVSDLHLRYLTLGPLQLACLGGLACQLTSLRLSACTLAGGDGAVLALCALSRLACLELCDLAGPSGEALDEALRGMPGLHSLRIDNRLAAKRGPTLRSLAVLPKKMHSLRIKQTPPRQALHLQHLSELCELRALELEGAPLTHTHLRGLGSLVHLSELLIPNAYQLTDGSAAALTALTALEALDLGSRAPAPHQALTDAGAAALWGLSRLTALSLAGRGGLTAAGLRFLPGCPGLAALDLDSVRLGGGDAAFLWQLGGLTSLSLAGTALCAPQFCGLRALAALRHLDASRTGFDNACCAELVPLTALTELRLCFVSGRLTAAGLAAVHGCRQLACLRLDGAAVSTRGMSDALAAHPAAVLWPAARGHLPRWVNALHVQLMAVPAPGCHRLRFLHAPEPSAWAQARVGAWAGGLIVTHAALMLLLGLVAMLLPMAAAAAAAWAGLACAARCSRAPARRMLVRWARMEALAAGLLAGLYSVEVPLPSLPARGEDY